MTDPILVLTVVSTLLTLIGSYRFVSYVFRNDPLFAGAVAAAATVTYLAVFEVVVLLMGILALISPVALFVKRDALKSSLKDLQASNQKPAGSVAKTEPPTYCPTCGEKQTPDSRFCRKCGERFDTGRSKPRNGDNRW